MPHIHLETLIAAPEARCFDLMRDVDAHTRTTGSSNERAIAGKTSGLLCLGDEVTWEARHFGVRQRLSVRVTRCEPPRIFEDQQIRGAFAGFTHRHEFRPAGTGTVMIDDFRYRSPLGPLGWVADRLFLERYMRAFLRERARGLKELAEAR